MAAAPIVMSRAGSQDSARASRPGVPRVSPRFLAVAGGLGAAGSQRTEPPASRTQSGHRTPPGVRIWHSGQIVRPHRWHSVQLVRSGWR